MTKKVKNDSFVPRGSDGLNSFGAPKMKGKNSSAAAGNAANSRNISGKPAVLKHVNRQGVFASGLKK